MSSDNIQPEHTEVVSQDLDYREASFPKEDEDTKEIIDASTDKKIDESAIDVEESKVDETVDDGEAGKIATVSTEESNLNEGEERAAHTKDLEIGGADGDVEEVQVDAELVVDEKNQEAEASIDEHLATITEEEEEPKVQEGTEELKTVDGVQEQMTGESEGKSIQGEIEIKEADMDVQAKQFEGSDASESEASAEAKDVGESANKTQSDDQIRDTQIRFGRKSDIDESEGGNLGVKFATSSQEEIKKPSVTDNCRDFQPLKVFAENFVDDLLEMAVGNAIDRIRATAAAAEAAAAEVDERSIKSPAGTLSTGSSQQYFQLERKQESSFTGWPKIEEFYIEYGGEKIDEYVYTWSFEENWLYCIDYLGEHSDMCSDYYEYEVKLSIPCNQYPVAQVTASVFFTYDVSRIKPSHCPVDIFYRFEGCRLIHTPDEYGFQEKWLFYILEAKIKLYKRVTF